MQQEHLRSAVGKLTGLVPAIESSGATQKRDTQDSIDAAPSQKLLKKGGLAEQAQAMAERVGFEPTVRFPVHTLSKRAP